MKPGWIGRVLATLWSWTCAWGKYTLRAGCLYYGGLPGAYPAVLEDEEKSHEDVHSSTE